MPRRHLSALTLCLRWDCRTGSAFDINYQWNRLGAIPALEGQKGSVREFAGIANEHGFFWGGHSQGRPDGMQHCELAQVSKQVAMADG
ncbi:MAG: M15 family metallopeptidase [Gammaproteobacteria bacterium]|nr:M15 family metallopeptidase [Gammaproteobacteria bacterium]MCF6363362.1 M15 family metallopeptidase [Gammaproteobacteria bacterium]